MMRLPVQSRRWNMALAILGSIYAVSAIALLAWLVIDVWGAESLSDRALQIALLGSAASGIWFVVKALQNLGIHGDKQWHESRLSRSSAH